MRHNGATPARSTLTDVPVPPGPDPAAGRAADGAGVVAWYAESFSDVLGDRLGLFDSNGPSLQLLRFSSTVLALPDFEIALRGRLALVFGFRHPAFAMVRGLTRLEEPSPQLALVSQQARGERLTTILRAAESRGARLGVDSAIWLLRHVVTALADFHEATGGLAHGWLDADRVTIAATGEVTVTEYVFGGISAAHAHAEPVDDIRDAAWLALAVLAGRPVAPTNRSDAITGVRMVDAICGGISPGSVLAPWLKRALSGGFSTARGAMVALEDLLAGVPGRWPTKLIADMPGVSSSAPPPAPARRRQPDVATSRAADEPAVAASPAAAESAAVARLTQRNRVLWALAGVQAVAIVALLLRGAPVGPARTSGQPNVVAAGTIGAPASAGSTPDPSPSALVADAVAAVAALPRRDTGAPAASSVIGWLDVDSSAPVRVYANGRLLGSTTRGRFGLPEGQHTITVVSDEHGFQSSQPVKIVSGRSALVAPRPVALP
jgi:hypothetical protein